MDAFEPGDTVQVIINTHKTSKGIISHTEQSAIFIFLKEDPHRIRIEFKDIQNKVKLIQKYNKDERNLLNSSQLQAFISSTTNEDGSNYHIIAKHYETGDKHFPIDFNKAMHWFSAGHNLQNIYCTISLADIATNYYHDYDSAEKYYQIGISQGYIYCAYIANVMYRELANKSEEDSKMSRSKAKEKELFYIKKYIEFTNENDAGVLLDFAVCQLTMNIPDYSQAYKYLDKALKLNPESIGIQQFLAIVLYRGLGCVQDENKAYEIHKQLATEKNSECSKLWMVVHDSMHKKDENVHPLRDDIYDAFMDVIVNGDSHGLYYGNWIKIVEYHAMNNCQDLMSLSLLIALRLFGFLGCDIDVQKVKKVVMNVTNGGECVWIDSWGWFFVERYGIVKQLTSFHDGLVELISEYELNILLE